MHRAADKVTLNQTNLLNIWTDFTASSATFYSLDWMKSKIINLANVNYYSTKWLIIEIKLLLN